MAIDRNLFGEAMAQVLDRLDKLEKTGQLSDDYEIGDVMIVAAFVRPFSPDDEVSPDAVETYILVDGTTQVPYVQDGLLRYGIAVVGSGDLES